MAALAFSVGLSVTMSVTGGIRVLLGTVVAGLTGYIYYGLGGPGATDRSRLGSYTPLIVSAGAGLVGLVYTWATLHSDHGHSAPPGSHRHDQRHDHQNSSQDRQRHVPCASVESRTVKSVKLRPAPVPASRLGGNAPLPNSASVKAPRSADGRPDASTSPTGWPAPSGR